MNVVLEIYSRDATIQQTVANERFMITSSLVSHNQILQMPTRCEQGKVKKD